MARQDVITKAVAVPEKVVTRVHDSFTSPLHEPRIAAFLGAALGITFSICFVTGLLSHLIQHPPSWFLWPSRPAGLYRVTQGVHVTMGMASIPILLAKLWVVAPHFWTWPSVRSFGHLVERISLIPLVGGGLFLLMTGVGNVARWYPWPFSFPPAHYALAWVTMGGMAIHLAAKWATTRAALRSPPSPKPPEQGNPPPRTPPPRTPEPPENNRTGGQTASPPSRDASQFGAGGRGVELEAALVKADAGSRRAFLGGVAAASGLMTVATAGGTFHPLGDLSILAQRQPGMGPQGVPVNKTASGARVVELATSNDFRLQVIGKVEDPLSLSLEALRSLPQHSAELPIACVEGWSQSAHWKGVRVRDLISLAGGKSNAEATVISLQERSIYAQSDLNRWHAHDPDTLLALELNGSPLHIDHGFPVRLIGPNRPGVMQTKWVHQLVVR